MELTDRIMGEVRRYFHENKIPFVVTYAWPTRATTTGGHFYTGVNQNDIAHTMSISTQQIMNDSQNQNR